jgi:hypothetical protein
MKFAAVKGDRRRWYFLLLPGKKSLPNVHLFHWQAISIVEHSFHISCYTLSLGMI